MGTTLHCKVEVLSDPSPEARALGARPTWHEVCRWDFGKHYLASIRLDQVANPGWPSDFHERCDDDLCERRCWCTAAAVPGLDGEDETPEWLALLASLGPLPGGGRTRVLFWRA